MLINVLRKVLKNETERSLLSHRTDSERLETANKDAVSHSFFHERRSHRTPLQLLQTHLPVVHLLHQSVQLSLTVALSYSNSRCHQPLIMKLSRCYTGWVVTFGTVRTVLGR